MVSQPLRAAGVGQARIQNGLHEGEFGTAIGQTGAADDITDHEQIGLQGELIDAEAFHQVDAQGAKLVAHRRVNTGVAAGDCVAGFARQCREAPHEGAANTEYVNMHGPILGCSNQGKIGRYGEFEI